MPDAAAVPAQASPGSGAAVALDEVKENNRNIDYARVVEEALASADANASMAALEIINKCQRIDFLISATLRRRAELPGKTQQINLLVEHLQTDQRRCQSLAPGIEGKKPDLAMNGVRGKVIGAASEYFLAKGFDVDVPQKQELVMALRRDAEGGHPDSLLSLLLHGGTLGLKDVDRRVYQLVHDALVARGGDAALGRSGSAELLRFMPYKNPFLGAEEESRAREAADAILAKCCQSRAGQ